MEMQIISLVRWFRKQTVSGMVCSVNVLIFDQDHNDKMWEKGESQNEYLCFHIHYIKISSSQWPSSSRITMHMHVQGLHCRYFPNACHICESSELTSDQWNEKQGEKNASKTLASWMVPCFSRFNLLRGSCIGVNIRFWNVGKMLPDYKVSHARRQQCLGCDNLKSHLLPRLSHKLFPLYLRKQLWNHNNIDNQLDATMTVY